MTKQYLDINKVKVDPELSILLESAQNNGVKLTALEECVSYDAFCAALQRLLDRSGKIFEADRVILRGSHREESKLPHRLMKELEEIGWNNVSFVSEDFTSMQISLLDLGNRAHTVDITISANYPKQRPQVNLAFP
jgi:hypothetical protein